MDNVSKKIAIFSPPLVQYLNVQHANLSFCSTTVGIMIILSSYLMVHCSALSVVVELVMRANLREVRVVRMGSATAFAAQEKVEGGRHQL